MPRRSRRSSRRTRRCWRPWPQQPRSRSHNRSSSARYVSCAQVSSCVSEEPVPAARLRSHRLVVGKVDAGSGGRGRPAVRAVVHVTDATDERARKAPRGYSCAVSNCALVSLPEGVTLGRPPCLSPTNGLRAALHGHTPGPPLTTATKAVARQSPVHRHSGAVDTHLDFSKGNSHRSRLWSPEGDGEPLII